MSNVVTFFTDNKDDESFYVTNIKLAEVKWEIHIYFNYPKGDRKNVIEKIPRIVNITEINSYDFSGIIVAHSSKSGKIDVHVAIIGAFESPPSTIFYLNPGAIKLRKPSVKNRFLNIIVATGAHIIIPINKSAENKFETFLKDCQDWFPHDFEINLSYLLRNPSLAHRVYRLETLANEPFWDKTLAFETFLYKLSKIKKKPRQTRLFFYLMEVVFPVFKALILGTGFLLISYASLNQLFPENSFFNCFGQCISTGSASDKIITEIHEKLSKLCGEKNTGTPSCSSPVNKTPAQISLENFKSTINSYKENSYNEKNEPYMPRQLYDQYFNNLNTVNSLDDLKKDGNIMRGMLYLYVAIESSDYKDYKFVIDRNKIDQNTYIRFNGKSIIESLKHDYLNLNGDLNNDHAISLVLRYYNSKKDYTDNEVCSFVAVIGHYMPNPALKLLESKLTFKKDKAFKFPNNCKPLEDKNKNYTVKIENEDNYIQDFMLKILKKLPPPA